jgi:hypothetical protein
VGGVDAQDHQKQLEATLHRLQKFNVKLNKQKCEFAVPTMQYLGHYISGRGLSPTADKVSAIKAAIAPTDQKTLRGF